MEWVKSIRNAREEFNKDKKSINAFSKANLNVYDPLKANTTVYNLIYIG